ncbi:MAG: hypothetical protein KJZ91_18450 [Myxococcales bacterium]|nr:hypothetical protein [Myxococcales bacterium]
MSAARALALAVAAALAAAVGGGAGCALFDGDPPDRSCRTDSDCFRAQGERCDTTARVCVMIDAGMAAPGEDEAPVDPAAPAGAAVEVTP